MRCGQCLKEFEKMGNFWECPNCGGLNEQEDDEE